MLKDNVRMEESAMHDVSHWVWGMQSRAILGDVRSEGSKHIQFARWVAMQMR